MNLFQRNRKKRTRPIGRMSLRNFMNNVKSLMHGELLAVDNYVEYGNIGIDFANDTVDSMAYTFYKRDSDKPIIKMVKNASIQMSEFLKYSGLRHHKICTLGKLYNHPVKKSIKLQGTRSVNRTVNIPVVSTSRITEWKSKMDRIIINKRDGLLDELNEFNPFKTNNGRGSNIPMGETGE